MIKDIIIMDGDFVEHDPIETKYIYDIKKNIWITSGRNIMKFIRPILVEYSQYDFFLNEYLLYSSEYSQQYYRPIEFYDHVYSPNEINNLPNKEIKKYINFFHKKKLFFEKNLYINFLKNPDKNIIKCIQENIKKDRYRIISSLNLNYSYNRQSIIFDETWNTIFYYHLLLPRRHKHFINIKEKTCNCLNFLKKNHCDHITIIMLYLIRFKYFLTFDIYLIIKNFL